MFKRHVVKTKIACLQESALAASSARCVEPIPDLDIVQREYVLLALLGVESCRYAMQLVTALGCLTL